MRQAPEEDFLCQSCRDWENGEISLESIFVAESHDKFAPPEAAMEMARCDNVVYFTMCKYEEGTFHRKADVKATFSMDIKTLLKALRALDVVE
jgi:hypothetical protein